MAVDNEGDSWQSELVTTVAVCDEIRQCPRGVINMYEQKFIRDPVLYRKPMKCRQCILVTWSRAQISLSAAFYAHCGCAMMDLDSIAFALQ